MTPMAPYRTASAWLTDHARDLGIDGTVIWQGGAGVRGFWLQREGMAYRLGKTSEAAEQALAALVTAPLLPLRCQTHARCPE